MDNIFGLNNITYADDKSQKNNFPADSQIRRSILCNDSFLYEISQLLFDPNIFFENSQKIHNFSLFVRYSTIYWGISLRYLKLEIQFIIYWSSRSAFNESKIKVLRFLIGYRWYPIRSQQRFYLEGSLACVPSRV